MLFTFLTFAAALRGLLSYVVEILQRRLFVRLVADLAYRLPRVRGTAFDGMHAPELVNRFFEIVTVQKAASSLLLDAVSIILQTFVGMAVLAFYHPFLLGFDLVLLMLIAFITFGLGRGAVKTAVNESIAKYAVGAWLEELVRHPTAFKLHSGHQFALDRSDRLTVDYLDARKKHYRIVLRQLLFALGLQATVATALLGLGGWLVIQGQLTLGQLVAAELIVTVIVGSFAKMGKHLESFYDLLASMDKLGHLFDLPTERHDKQFHLQAGVPAEVAVRRSLLQLRRSGEPRTRSAARRELGNQAGRMCRPDRTVRFRQEHADRFAERRAAAGVRPFGTGRHRSAGTASRFAARALGRLSRPSKSSTARSTRTCI